LQNNTFSGLFVGQNIVVLQRIDSTNNYLKLELTKSKPLPEGTVIMAEDQYAGRGQAQNKWLSQAGKNLTFSVLLYPTFITPENQFNLNIAVCLAINDVLAPIIGSGLKIKWPNDIYFGDDKLGGILIENSLQGNSWRHAIIGIGLNINQEYFDPDIRNVTSLKKILHQDYDLNTLLGLICKTIQQRYLELRDVNGHISEYLKVLYRLNETHSFNINGSLKEGVIVGVDKAGYLQLLLEGEVSTFGLKEVFFVIP
jgi:BirA family transcriptional regulator, biotin operon repressor / biotin---[acetyl-CoA-carboxylase] ligase